MELYTIGGNLNSIGLLVSPVLKFECLFLFSFFAALKHIINWLLIEAKIEDQTRLISVESFYMAVSCLKCSQHLQ